MISYRIRRNLFVLVWALFAFALTFASVGCMKQARRELPSVQESWQKALDLFHRERYYGAQSLLKDIVLNFSGSSIIDSAQFYLARTDFELHDYLVAADEFHRVTTSYPSSQIAGDASFWEARCFYELSPSFGLDQEYTNKAFDAFQKYLEEYSGHSLADSAYKYMAFCREKLARKEYASAELYFTLDEYASAVMYADLLLSDYYDTPWADPAQFLKARSFYALKDWARAKEELETYLNKYDKGKYLDRARSMLSTANGNLASK